jgi:hypothetical protein
MVDQESFVWSIKQYAQTNDDVDGGLFYIPEMLAYPGEPSDPYPLNNSVLPSDTVSINLSVVVHGDQTYDVAFYLSMGIKHMMLHSTGQMEHS